MAAARKGSSTAPPDGGWGWMIVIGCFLVTICTRAVTRCISIFFVEFQTYFAQDYARTAWIHSIVDCATMLCAPLGSFISNHVSSQVGIMLGGLLASAGFILSSFATTLEHLYLSLGILTGLGFALSYSPAIAMVGNYFHKRKALAYGIAMSGCGIGTFLLAPVVQLLIEHFSWRGALLILGGFVLNLCVCGALMRPVAGKEDHKNTLEFPEQDFELEVQKPGFEQWSFCSPVIKIWSRKCVCRCSQQEYDFALMPDFVMLAVSILFMAYGCSPLFVYLVPYALSVGVSHQQAAFLMSVLGVIDIVGNITFGWLTDRRCLKKYRYVCYLFAVAMDGLCCLFLPVLQSFPLLLPFSFTFGYFDGAYITLIPVVTADVVGTASLSSALGMVYFLHAIPYLISPPVAEVMRCRRQSWQLNPGEQQPTWTQNTVISTVAWKKVKPRLRLACGYNWQLHCIFPALWVFHVTQFDTVVLRKTGQDQTHFLRARGQRHSGQARNLDKWNHSLFGNWRTGSKR